MASEKTILSESVEAKKDGYGSEPPLCPGLTWQEALNDGYGLEPHAKFSALRNIIDYEPLKLGTFRVFCLSKGTILESPVLFLEQLLLTLLFACVAAPTYHFFHMDMGHGGKKEVSGGEWLAAQEGKMRAFAMIMTNLAAFLLTFYTSISVARWWVMRTGGVGSIKAATLDLEWMLYQNVTQEEEVLSAVRRYGRTSLVLIFMWRQGKLDKSHVKEELVGRKLLNEHEVDQLFKWNHCLHETIWAWQGAIVTMLHKEGKIKSPDLFKTLLLKCTEGRAAVQLAHTHLAVRVPMQYVHLLGLLVKMHNLVIAIIMGGLFGAALRNQQIIICVQTFARTLILPFLFNAILLINAELADPFSAGGGSDFPGMIYQENLDKDCKGFVSASQNMPDWALARTQAV